jgi:hypothetical protein
VPSFHFLKVFGERTCFLISSIITSFPIHHGLPLLCLLYWTPFQFSIRWTYPNQVNGIFEAENVLIKLTICLLWDYGDFKGLWHCIIDGCVCWTHAKQQGIWHQYILNWQQQVTDSLGPINLYITTYRKPIIMHQPELIERHL